MFHTLGGLIDQIHLGEDSHLELKEVRFAGLLRVQAGQV